MTCKFLLSFSFERPTSLPLKTVRKNAILGMQPPQSYEADRPCKPPCRVSRRTGSDHLQLITDRFFSGFTSENLHWRFILLLQQDFHVISKLFVGVLFIQRKGSHPSKALGHPSKTEKWIRIKIWPTTILLCLNGYRLTSASGWVCECAVAYGISFKSGARTWRTQEPLIGTTGASWVCPHRLISAFFKVIGILIPISDWAYCTFLRCTAHICTSSLLSFWKMFSIPLTRNS